MTSIDAIRFLAHEAQRCRDRDAHEALCLWLPALCKVLNVPPADDFDSIAIQSQCHRELRALAESPLLEAHCEACDFAESLPQVRFTTDPRIIGDAPKQVAWCGQCHTQRLFLCREAVPA